MARLPVSGSDEGTWGDILNDFLTQTHTDQGLLKPDSVGSAQIQANAVTSAQLAPDAVTADSVADGSIAESQLDANVQTKLNANSGGDMSAATYDPQNIADDAFARANHTGTQPASTISDFDAEVSNNADVAAATAHIANTSNPHTVTKAQVGLGNVDNTSDTNKPISTATQTALDGKAATNHTHANVPVEVIRPTDSAARSANVTMANDDVLQFQAETNSVYLVELIVVYSSSTVADFRWNITAPSGSAGGYTSTQLSDGYNSGFGATGGLFAFGTNWGAGGGGVNAYSLLEGRAYIVTGVTPGTVAFQWAQWNSDPTNSVVRKGSFLRYRKAA